MPKQSGIFAVTTNQSAIMLIADEHQLKRDLLGTKWEDWDLRNEKVIGRRVRMEPPASIPVSIQSVASASSRRHCSNRGKRRFSPTRGWRVLLPLNSHSKTGLTTGCGEKSLVDVAT